MDLSEHVRPLLDHALARLDLILEKAAGYARSIGCADEVLLGARLFPDMIDTLRNIQNVCEVTHRGAVRLAGGEPPSFANDERTFADLRARVAAARAAIADLAPVVAAETVMFKDHAGVDRTVTAEVFVLRYLLPNVHFHMAVAYALLRSQGAPLGKHDIMGDPPNV